MDQVFSLSLYSKSTKNRGMKLDIVDLLVEKKKVERFELQIWRSPQDQEKKLGWLMGVAPSDLLKAEMREDVYISLPPEV